VSTAAESAIDESSSLNGFMSSAGLNTIAGISSILPQDSRGSVSISVSAGEAVTSDPVVFFDGAPDLARCASIPKVIITIPFPLSAGHSIGLAVRLEYLHAMCYAIHRGLRSKRLQKSRGQSVESWSRAS
jgi:hypothetical protein